MEIKELVQNEDFRKAMSAAQSLEEVMDLLKANGLEVSEEDLNALLAQRQTGELDEEALENVAGGAKRVFSYLRPLLPLLPLIPVPILPRWKI